MTRARNAGWSALEWGGLALCFLLGVLNLWNPFSYDQALFAMGGDHVLSGGLLYRDFWDTKQPGIFWFFAFGIRLFGLSEEGVHLLELFWYTAFAAVLMTTLRRAFDHRWGSVASALLVVGFYWAITRDWHQTQPEGLVQFPLFVALWFALEASRMERGAWPRWLLAGLAGGVVGVFKLLLVALPALFWLVLIGARLADSRPGRAREVALALAGLALGFLLPVGAMLAALAAQGLLPDAWYTWVVFPRWVTSQIHGLPLRAWEETFHWFFQWWSPVLALAVVGAWTSLRGRQAMFARLLVLWLAAGFPLLLAQKFSGWQYHLMLFLVPLGILAARGLDALAKPLAELRPPGSPRERRMLLLAALIAVFAQPVSAVAVKTAELLKDRFVTTPALRARHMLRVSQGGGYYRFTQEGEFLRAPGARPGPIFVIGNPLVQWLAGRKSSVPRNGDILFEHHTAEEWADDARRLERTKTPYVFVEAPRLEQLETFRPRSDALLDLLGLRYRVMRESRYGTWFEWSDSSTTR
ncbi:MAG: glycosyltransferase family 39 protein [Candidatus Eisenbacteria bacterium]